MALGEASTCWSKLDQAGVFDSQRARGIIDRLVARIETDRDQARLGLATTRELIEELNARAEIAYFNGETWPGYRTVALLHPRRGVR